MDPCGGHEQEEEAWPCQQQHHTKKQTKKNMNNLHLAWATVPANTEHDTNPATKS